MSKNIVICCDGTNNEVVGNQTNVLRLFRMLARDEQQVSFYDAGVGTHADPTAQWSFARRLKKTLDAGIGESIRPNVLDAYRFLINRYVPGDLVYLFGFSRGAYTVRALAAMLYRCGLLYPEHEHLAPYAWGVFTDEDQSGNRRAMFGGSARIKKVFGREAPVHLIGVWDTVAAFGWIWDLMTIPNTVTNPIVSHVRHALSIDERRSQFLPEWFVPWQAQDVKEVWFAGAHSDVGGGYKDTEAGLARISLEWMLKEVVPLSLRIDAARQHEQTVQMGNSTPDLLGPQHDEAKKLKWRLLGWLPRRAYSSIAGRPSWSWPNQPSRRTIPPNAFVHISVQNRMLEVTPPYRPSLPANHSFVS